MQNKENGNKRSCYFCFNDPKNEEIIWFVPISSKVEKYKIIYEENFEAYLEQMSQQMTATGQNHAEEKKDEKESL